MAFDANQISHIYSFYLTFVTSFLYFNMEWIFSARLGEGSISPSLAFFVLIFIISFVVSLMPSFIFLT